MSPNVKYSPGPSMANQLQWVLIFNRDFLFPALYAHAGEGEGRLDIFLNYPDYSSYLALDFTWLEKALVCLSFPAVFHVCVENS